MKMKHELRLCRQTVRYCDMSGIEKTDIVLLLKG